jgi:hypothetical protein
LNQGLNPGVELYIEPVEPEIELYIELGIELYIELGIEPWIELYI